MITYNGQIEYDYSLCQQCGACYAVCSINAIKLRERQDGTKDIIVDHSICIKCKRCKSVCPSNRIAFNEYFETLKSRHFCLAYNNNDEIRKKSSSGGACRTIIIESLKLGFVDGVYTLKKLGNYPAAEGCFFTSDNIPSYNDLSTSVYHSVMACLNVDKVQKCKRLMLVGTSCQLYALERALKGKYEELVKVCIFCKQQKTLDSTKFLAKVLGTKIDENKFVSSYRGPGWPGVVNINGKVWEYNQASGLLFGRRLWTVPGCNICADPFGIQCGTDLTLMDPWHIRQPNELGETLVCIHTEKGHSLINNIKALSKDEISYSEVEPALDLLDIKRKQLLVKWWKGESVDPIISEAGICEMEQRQFLENVLTRWPKLPKFFYRILNKFYPHKRDAVLSISAIKKLQNINGY